MKGSLAVTLAISTSFFVLAAAWQAGRYTALAAETRTLEAEQEDWIEENRKLEAGIAVLESRERAAAAALALGLDKTSPDRRLLVRLRREAGEDSDG